MTDTDVEMLDMEALSLRQGYETIDDAFNDLAESDEEYFRWYDNIHTCWCHLEGCVSCAVRDCDHHDPDHYHHDGCPSCTPRAPQIEAGRERQVGNVTIVEFNLMGVNLPLPFWQ